jgi:hypothetical protein
LFMQEAAGGGRKEKQDMFAIPVPGQSIINDEGQAWLVHSVSRRLASTVVNLVPLGARHAGRAVRRLEMPLSDFRIFCTFMGVRARSWAQERSDARALPAPTARQPGHGPNADARRTTSHDDHASSHPSR